MELIRRTPARSLPATVEAFSAFSRAASKSGKNFTSFGREWAPSGIRPPPLRLCAREIPARADSYSKVSVLAVGVRTFGSQMHDDKGRGGAAITVGEVRATWRGRGDAVPDATVARVLVVDDHPVVRAGIAAVLGRETFIDVAGLAASGEEALALFDRVEPDVVLLDYRLPGMDGAATCAEMVRRRPEAAVVILTTHIDDEIIHACLGAGARGYLVKDVSAADLVSSIEAILCGEAILAPRVTDKIVRWARASKALVDGGPFLSVEELTTLSLVARGLSTSEIAQHLEVGAHVVKAMVRSTVSKLGVDSRSEAVAVAVRRGLI